MATGVTPDRHGILDFVEKDPARGVMVPVTGRSRRVPAVWNIASALDRTVAVVGWWGSWPADKVNGLVVSDRLYYTLTQGLTKEVLREDPPEMVFPEGRRIEFVELRNRAVRETDWQAIRYFMDVDETVFMDAVAANRGMEDPVDGFRRLLAATRTYLGAGMVAGESSPDLAMVYLEGTDTIGHLLAPYVPPPTLEVDPALAEVYAAAVPKYFEIVDRWIGRYLGRYPLDEYAVLLVSDHGFKWSEGRPRGLSGTEGPTAALWHEADAAFVVSGRGVRALGRMREQASIYDVAPTIAALLGLPPDQSWKGEVLPGCPPSALEPIDYLSLVPPESYRPDTGDAAPVDPEFISKLRSLGYLGGSEDEAGRPSSTSSTTAGEVARAEPVAGNEIGKASLTTTRGELNNLAILKINEKKYSEATDLLRRAIAQSPTYASPHFNLRRIHMENEQWDDADRELWIAIDKGLRDSERTLDRAAADYESLGMPRRALALLERALERFPGHEPFWVHLMVANIRLGECQRGLELGPTASQKFPDSAPVHAFYGLAAACVGDTATARTEIERSLALNPDQETLRRTLSGLP
jgi:tetratricopeptide (TPR) repeat protein